MDMDAFIERALERAVAAADGNNAPPKLISAIRHAIFPGGARVRPQLCLAVAHACGARTDVDFKSPVGAAAAIELLHCASLIHDDLPCFDDAGVRRGKASVHVAYGEPLGVLAGDAMIVMAFETLLRECAGGDKLEPLMSVVIEAVGPPFGIVAGQAWESEPSIDLSLYHRSKTGAMFVAATMAGAAAMGADKTPWRIMGDRLGEAYQIADDIRDHVMEDEALGKPAGQDAAMARPNAVDTLGLRGAFDQLNDLIDDAAEAVPDCAGADNLRALVYAQARRLAPKELMRSIA